MSKKLNKQQVQRGNLLLELGLTLVVVGTLAAAIIGGFSSIEQARATAEQNAQLELAKQSLKAFVLKANRLPCPDLTGTGWEGDAAGGCADSVRVGRLPYISLNMPIPGNGYFLKYGVSRISPSSDLVKSGQPPNSIASPSAFVAAALAASLSPAGTSEPYIAGTGDDGRLSNCENASSTPAYALMLVTEKTASQNPLCFHEASLKLTRVSYMRFEELLGWASARMR